jgi:hypothetical protein
MDEPKRLQTKKQPKARSEDFVLICATTLGFMEVSEIWDIVDSITYV